MKKFICSNFINPVVDAYEVTGAEDWVVEQGTNHVVAEHGYMDSPQLREDIKKSLIDVPPGD